MAFLLLKSLSTFSCATIMSKMPNALQNHAFGMLAIKSLLTTKPH
jgi:hypothetical protein